MSGKNDTSPFFLVAANEYVSVSAIETGRARGESEEVRKGGEEIGGLEPAHLQSQSRRLHPRCVHRGGADAA